jgi:hypothetical protein
MNAKQAKKIRRSLRLHGIDPSERSYISKETLKLVSILDERGILKPRQVLRLTYMLSPECGRADYRRIQRGIPTEIAGCSAEPIGKRRAALHGVSNRFRKGFEPMAYRAMTSPETSSAYGA